MYIFTQYYVCIAWYPDEISLNMWDSCYWWLPFFDHSSVRLRPPCSPAAPITPAAVARAPASTRSRMVQSWKLELVDLNQNVKKKDNTHTHIYIYIYIHTIIIFFHSFWIWNRENFKLAIRWCCGASSWLLSHQLLWNSDIGRKMRQVVTATWWMIWADAW